MSKIFYIDFSTWRINADSEEEAEKIALAKLYGGNVPSIVEVEEDEDADPDGEEDEIDSFNIIKDKGVSR